jgi:hypothetical protein
MLKIGSRVHIEAGLITACGRLISDEAEQVESEATCLVCIKADKTLIDPDSVAEVKLVFGKPETGDQFVEANRTRKAALRSSARVGDRNAAILVELDSIRRKLENGTLANRCPCGKFPWEHTTEDKCGPRTSHRRGKLLRLYLSKPHGSLAGSDALVRKAIAE